MANWCAGPLSWQDPAAVLWLVAGAAVLEEWVFRAGLQAWLLRGTHRFPLSRNRHVRAVQSVVIVALVFSALHGLRGGLAAVGVFPAALALGVLYVRSGSWRLCALAHGVGNGLLWLVCRSGVS